MEHIHFTGVAWEHILTNHIDLITSKQKTATPTNVVTPFTETIF